MNKNILNDLIQEIEDFRNARNWKQFHNIKDQLISLNLEAGELLELIQWQSSEEFQTKLKSDRTLKDQVSDELADIFYWILLISNDLEIDLEKAFQQKMHKNKLKYPVEKSRNNKAKYTENI